MLRIVCFCAFALVSTAAFACDEYDWSCGLHEAVREKEAADRAERFHSDEMFMRQREMDARANEAYMADQRQGMIQGQLNQLNMNTVPLR